MNSSALWCLNPLSSRRQDSNISVLPGLTLTAILQTFYVFPHFQHWCFFSNVMNDKWEGGLWICLVAAFLFFLVSLPIVLVLNELRKNMRKWRALRDLPAWQTQTHCQRIPVEFKNAKETRQRQWDSEMPQGTRWHWFFFLSPIWSSVGGFCALVAYGRATRRHFHMPPHSKHASVCSLCCCCTPVIWSAIP